MFTDGALAINPPSQVLCVLDGQCFDKTNNPAVQTLVSWFTLPMVCIVLTTGMLGP